MKIILAILFFFTIPSSDKANDDMMPGSNSIAAKKYYWLALGDSYTIGEKVIPAENYPNQAVKLLIKDSLDFQPARIIAKTGWTTDELETGIASANAVDPLRPSYDFVSLLIGVNNQYRGQNVDNYKPEFEKLLKEAIHFAGDRADHVVVLSIPDWSVTPFAAGSDRARIAREIDAYNAANKQIAEQYHVDYIDITSLTREAAVDATLIAGDGLHPSGKEYQRWAEKIAAFFKRCPMR
jgi:lysophospholipase L1-like esterase